MVFFFEWFICIQPISSYCIRNTSAALVMNYGNEPVYDLQASSYAYKMRI